MKSVGSPAPPLTALLAAAAAAAYAAFLIHEVLVPFALSFALAYLLDPAIRRLEARGIRRDLVVLTLYLALAGAVTATANSVVPAASRELALLQARAPQYFLGLRERLSEIQTAVAGHLPLGGSMVESLSLKMYGPLVDQIPKLPAYALSLVPLLSLLFLVPFITFFVLMDSNRILRRLVQVCPSRHVEQALHLVSEIDASLGNYIRGVLIIALAIAGVSYAGLAALRVDYALAIAVLSGLASFVPYLGAILGMAVGATVAFFQYQNFAVPLKVVLLFLGIRLADEALLVPAVARRSVRLHPLAFLLALMAGGKLFGFAGLLFAVPAACVLKALLGVLWDWYVTEARMAPPAAPVDLRMPYV